MSWCFDGRIFHEGNRHLEGINVRAPDAGELDNILAAEAVAPVADVVTLFAARCCGEELSTIHTADLLGLVKVLQVAAADHAAGLVGHRYRMGEMGDKDIPERTSTW